MYAGVTWRRRGEAAPTVYLTFDDGPIPEVTLRLLALLREQDVRATFFVVGDNAARHPELLEAIYRDGHRVGNHTFHHLKGLKTPTAAYLQDVSRCQALLRPGLPLLFRPPYGRMRLSQKLALRRQGYECVLWDVLTHDYNASYSTDKMLQLTLRYVRPGSIIVFHDSLRSNERMLCTLPPLIAELRQRGYQFGLL